MRRAARRFSLKLALADVRRALGSSSRAELRYGRNVDVYLRMHWVRRALLEAEKQLRFCVRDALAHATPAQKRRRAA